MYQQREMRRFKQLLSEADTAAVLERGTNGVLNLIGDDGYPYGVPMSYAYADGKIYCHSGKKGYKIDAIKACDKASFTVVDEDQIVAEEFTTYFRSVICFGKVRLATEKEEYVRGHLALCDKYSPGRPIPPHDAYEKVVNTMDIIVLDIEAMTGKEAIEFVRAREGK